MNVNEIERGIIKFLQLEMKRYELELQTIHSTAKSKRNANQN